MDKKWATHASAFFILIAIHPLQPDIYLRGDYNIII